MNQQSRPPPARYRELCLGFSATKPSRLLMVSQVHKHILSPQSTAFAIIYQYIYIMTLELDEVNNSGLVRPTHGLGFEPDFVDCPNCRRRRKTLIVKAPSETTRYAQLLCPLTLPFGDFADLYRQKKFSMGVRTCGLCYKVPDWMQMDYDTVHKCPCGHTLAVIRLNSQLSNAAYVPSIYATEE